MLDRLPPEVLRAHKGKSFVGVTTAVAIFNRKGQIFLAQRSQNARDEHGRWDICGGGLKWGTRIEDNIRREMKEEFDAVSSSPLEFIGIREAFRTDEAGDKTHWVATDYAVILSEAESDGVKIIETDIFDDSGWFYMDKLPSPLHSQLHDQYQTNLQNFLAKKSLK